MEKSHSDEIYENESPRSIEFFIKTVKEDHPRCSCKQTEINQAIQGPTVWTHMGTAPKQYFGSKTTFTDQQYNRIDKHMTHICQKNAGPITWIAKKIRATRDKCGSVPKPCNAGAAKGAARNTSNCRNGFRTPSTKSWPLSLSPCKNQPMGSLAIRNNSATRAF